jgi:hypothetical protein
MNYLIKIGFVAFSLFLLISCGDKKIFEETIVPQNQQWNIYDSINFNFEISDTSKPYKMTLGIRIDKQKMLERCIPLSYIIKYPSGENRTGLKNLIMDSAKVVDGVSEFVIFNYKQFNNSGKYHFAFYQSTSRYNLEGIEGVTLRINETKVRKANEDEE